jgi:hypothetical protein
MEAEMYKFAVVALVLYLPTLSADDRRNNLWVGIDNDILPQIADGDYWKTSITLVNMDTEPAQYKLTFRQNGGAALVLDFVGLGQGSVITGTLPVNGSYVIETLGTSPTLSQGFAILESPNYKEVNGYGIFRQRFPWRTQDFEAVTPFSSQFDDDFILPFDNTAGYTTSLAICNPSSYSDETVTVAFYDDAGNRFHLDQFTLRPYEHAGLQTDKRWPETINKRGTAVFQVSPWGAPVLGLRFNSTGPFTSTHTLSR